MPQGIGMSFSACAGKRIHDCLRHVFVYKNLYGIYIMAVLRNA